ncbi:MAG: heat-inducible transcription repressor HrcA [Clostridia bacterium]|nr:heat-inducible transcription repressor HrcA [Clostridia bacterium]
MELNDRKKKILQAIIDEYIGTAEPVGSRAISKKEDLKLSSATIRNEMADLEEMGYLIQPHTSAGRVPSDEGYRFYVNSLMQNYKIGMEQIAQLQNLLEARVSQLEKLIRYTGAIASNLTEYTTIISAPKDEDSKINKIDLVPVEPHTVMMIVVTKRVRSGTVNANLNREACERLSQIINKKLHGKKTAEITKDDIEEIRAEAQNLIKENTLKNILDYLYDTIKADTDTEIYVTNANSILSYPEFSDVNKAKNMLSFLDDKEKLRKLTEADTGEGIEAKIGKENDFEILQDSSLVSMNYTLPSGAAGKLTVIGPKRMNYSKVFASLDLISNEIEKILNYYMNGS